MIDFTKYKSVAEYYLEKSQQICDRATGAFVFKTDAWNEANGQPNVGGIIGSLKGINDYRCIEINGDRVINAKGRLGISADSIKIVVGDIRALLYEDKAFNVLLDLSTIDHVVLDDMPRVIREYARVLKPDGFMLLISWCDDNFKPERIAEYSPNTQYYHSKELLLQELKQYFEIGSEDYLLKQDGKSLIEFVCKRKGL